MNNSDYDKLNSMISDWAETDTKVRELAREILGDQVDGSPDHVPNIVEIVENLVRLCKQNSDKVITSNNLKTVDYWPPNEFHNIW